MGKELQMKLFSENDPGQAKKAYKAFVKLTDAVRASSTNGATPFETTAASGGSVGDAAQKFSDATYPLVQKIDWGTRLSSPSTSLKCLPRIPRVLPTPLPRRFSLTTPSTPQASLPRRQTGLR